MVQRTNKNRKAFISGLFDGLSASTRVTSGAKLDLHRQSVSGVETDWLLVGDDLRNGMRRYEKEVKKTGT